VSAADLDALDRGVIEAGQLAAEALSRIAALEAEVGQLRKWAGLPESAPVPKPQRPRHLRRVT
jgi:hypothetical protein